MEKYKITITHFPKTKCKLMSQEIEAVDFEMAHTFAIALNDLVGSRLSHDTFYTIERM